MLSDTTTLRSDTAQLELDTAPLPPHHFHPPGNTTTNPGLPTPPPALPSPPLPQLRSKWLTALLSLASRLSRSVCDESRVVLLWMRHLSRCHEAHSTELTPEAELAASLFRAGGWRSVSIPPLTTRHFACGNGRWREVVGWGVLHHSTVPLAWRAVEERHALSREFTTLYSPLSLHACLLPFVPLYAPPQTLLESFSPSPADFPLQSSPSPLNFPPMTPTLPP